MFLAIKGKQALLKCNECSEYFSVENGFWPPNYQISAICPECGAKAKWVWEKPEGSEIPIPNIVWTPVAKETLDG